MRAGFGASTGVKSKRAVATRNPAGSGACVASQARWADWVAKVRLAEDTVVKDGKQNGRRDKNPKFRNLKSQKNSKITNPKFQKKALWRVARCRVLTDARMRNLKGFDLHLPFGGLIVAKAQSGLLFALAQHQRRICSNEERVINCD